MGTTMRNTQKATQIMIIYTLEVASLANWPCLYSIYLSLFQFFFFHPPFFFLLLVLPSFVALSISQYICIFTVSFSSFFLFFLLLLSFSSSSCVLFISFFYLSCFS